jgi:hypothetical protein
LYYVPRNRHGQYAEYIDMTNLQNAPQCRQQKKSRSEKCRQVVTSSFRNPGSPLIIFFCTSQSWRYMYALKGMCWQVLFVLEKMELVSFIIDPRLLNMGENIPGKGLCPYANYNVLLFDHTGKPILSILLTDLGKQLVPGSTKNRIRDVIEKQDIKCQDFTETFLKRAHAFAMSDGNDWFKTTAWCFGGNFAEVVATREEQKNKQQERRAGKTPLGAPKPCTLKTQVGGKNRPNKGARGAPKPPAPKTPVGAKNRPKKA